MSASINKMFFFLLKKIECAKFAIVCLGKGMNYRSIRQSQQTISRRFVRSLFQAGKRFYVSCIYIINISEVIWSGDNFFHQVFSVKSHVTSRREQMKNSPKIRIKIAKTLSCKKVNNEPLRRENL